MCSLWLHLSGDSFSNTSTKLTASVVDFLSLQDWVCLLACHGRCRCVMGVCIHWTGLQGYPYFRISCFKRKMKCWVVWKCQSVVSKCQSVVFQLLCAAHLPFLLTSPSLPAHLPFRLLAHPSSGCLPSSSCVQQSNKYLAGWAAGFMIWQMKCQSWALWSDKWSVRYWFLFTAPLASWFTLCWLPSIK